MAEGGKHRADTPLEQARKMTRAHEEVPTVWLDSRGFKSCEGYNTPPHYCTRCLQVYWFSIHTTPERWEQIRAVVIQHNFSEHSILETTRQL